MVRDSCPVNRPAVAARSVRKPSRASAARPSTSVRASSSSSAEDLRCGSFVNTTYG